MYDKETNAVKGIKIRRKASQEEEEAKEKGQKGSTSIREELEADFVVCASGRKNQVKKWLHEAEVVTEDQPLSQCTCYPGLAYCNSQWMPPEGNFLPPPRASSLNWYIYFTFLKTRLEGEKWVERNTELFIHGFAQFDQNWLLALPSRKRPFHDTLLFLWQTPSADQNGENYSPGWAYNRRRHHRITQASVAWMDSVITCVFLSPFPHLLPSPQNSLIESYSFFPCSMDNLSRPEKWTQHVWETGFSLAQQFRCSRRHCGK